MPEQAPSAPYYCPVCGQAVARLWVWQQPGGDQARLFCEVCAGAPEYAALPSEGRTLLDLDGFNAWAGRRMLRHVFEKEHPDTASGSA